jgi:HrpA-like RNA helicase
LLIIRVKISPPAVHRSLHDAQPDFPAPDIGRVPLENVVLTTRAMFPSSLSVQQLLAQVKSPSELSASPYELLASCFTNGLSVAQAIDPPPPERVAATVGLLASMGALETTVGAAPGDPTAMELTRLGIFASSMPLVRPTPQAARGRARPPCRHFKIQSC